MHVTYYQQLWLKQNNHLKVPQVVFPISSCKPRCQRVGYRTDTLCQGRGQEVNSLNELSLLPLPPLCSAYYVLSSSDLQGLELRFFLWTCSSSNVPPRRPNTSENQRRRKRRKRGSGEKDTLSRSRRPDYCHIRKTTSVPPLPFKKRYKRDPSA